MPQNVGAVLAEAFGQGGSSALPYAGEFRLLVQEHMTELAQVGRGRPRIDLRRPPGAAHRCCCRRNLLPPPPPPPCRTCPRCTSRPATIRTLMAGAHRWPALVGSPPAAPLPPPPPPRFRALPTKACLPAAERCT